VRSSRATSQQVPGCDGWQVVGRSWVYHPAVESVVLGLCGPSVHSGPAPYGGSWAARTAVCRCAPFVQVVWMAGLPNNWHKGHTPSPPLIDRSFTYLDELANITGLQVCVSPRPLLMDGECAHFMS